MREWFESLQQRERLFVLAGAAAIVLALLYLLVVAPLQTGYRNLKADNESWTTSLAELEALRPHLSQTATTGNTVQGGNDSPLIIVNRTLTSRGLKSFEKRSTPVSSNGIRVEFEAVGFDDLVLWLGELDRNYGLSVQAATFSGGSRLPTGRVNAVVTMERAL